MSRGKKTVKSRWVDRWTRDGLCKSRFVAMEIAYELRDDCWAGTPAASMIRWVLSDAATGDSLKNVSIVDVTCAFLHADMTGEAELWLILPPGMCPPGTRGRCNVALYGSRRAPQLWG